MNYGENKIIIESIKNILKQLGEDTEREGLKDTPKRVAKAYEEWFGGYNKTLDDLNIKTFISDYTGMITETQIKLLSFCEHHMAPFIGFAHVAYIPNPKTKEVVGLSKLVRIVNLYAKRLQIQEQLTQQIAEAIDKKLNPLGVGVQIVAQHMCMSSRGVNDQENKTTTTVLLKEFQKASVKAEFFNIIRDNYK